MNNKYLPTDLNGKLARLSEECAEVSVECGLVIQAISKIQRFGIENHHPETKLKNSDNLAEKINDLMNEISDLFHAIVEFNNGRI